MILGRSKALWIGLTTAILNAAVVVFHVPFDAVQLTVLNTLILAAAGILANEENPNTVGTFEATTKAT